MAMGYQGRILHVDLTEGRTWTEEPGELFYRAYLGGPGIGVYYLLKEMQPGTARYGPGNILTFAAGTLTHTAGPRLPLSPYPRSLSPERWASRRRAGGGAPNSSGPAGMPW